MIREKRCKRRSGIALPSRSCGSSFQGMFSDPTIRRFRKCLDEKIIVSDGGGGLPMEGIATRGNRYFGRWDFVCEGEQHDKKDGDGDGDDSGDGCGKRCGCGNGEEVASHGTNSSVRDLATPPGCWG